MIKRVSELPEINNDPRISFDWLMELILKAMTLRNSQEHLDLLFKIMDVDGNTRIYPYDVQRL